MATKFECSICGRFFDSEALCFEHLENEEQLSGNFEVYVITHYDVTEDLTEAETTTIEDSPEETPDETVEVITQQELEDRYNLNVILENWSDLSETEKTQVLSVLMGQVSGQDKRFSEQTKTENALRKHGKRSIELINRGQCPICDVHYEQLGWREQHKDLADKKFPIIMHHIETVHTNLYAILKDLWSGVPELEPSEFSPNSEACSENEDLEELSKEELYQKAVEDPSFRQSLFHRWKKRREIKE